MEFLKLMEGWEGFKDVGNKRFSEAQVSKAVDLLTNAKGYASHKAEYLLREAITTDDFPTLFGFIIDRELLARYKVAVADWKSYFKMSTVTNFNTAERHKVLGADERLPEVAEKGEYLVAPMSTGHYDLKVKKYGKQFDVSWEAIINDAMGAFSDIPQRFADAAIRSEAFAATSNFVMASGPSTLMFGATITDPAGGAVTNEGTLALTIANLETTLGLMSRQLDANGEPISVRGIHLVVPPALEFTARAILNSSLILSTAVAPIPAMNIIPQLGLQLHVDPYLPIVDTTDANHTWYLFAEPSSGAAMEFAYLRGHEAPEICMRASDKVTSAGGALSPFSGDFATDNILYRVRSVFGCTQLDPRFCYAQIG